MKGIMGTITRITESPYLYDFEDFQKTWFLEEYMGEFFGWKDICYVEAPDKNAARELLKQKLIRMVDEAE